MASVTRIVRFINLSPMVSAKKTKQRIIAAARLTLQVRHPCRSSSTRLAKSNQLCKPTHQGRSLMSARLRGFSPVLGRWVVARGQSTFDLLEEFGVCGWLGCDSSKTLKIRMSATDVTATLELALRASGPTMPRSIGGQDCSQPTGSPALRFAPASPDAGHERPGSNLIPGIVSRGRAHFSPMSQPVHPMLNSIRERERAPILQGVRNRQAGWRRFPGCACR